MVEIYTDVEAALNYAANGWYVFPTKPLSKFPFKDFKWKEQSTNNPDKIKRAAHSPVFRDCNWAIDCGKSGLLVLDIDNKPDRDGFKTIVEKYNIHPHKLNTLKVSTPSNGMHLYFSGVGPTSNDKLGDGLDTRGTGGYVLLPGSKTDKGTYKLINETYTHILPSIPAWIADSLAHIDQTKHADREIPLIELDLDQNIDRAITYLSNEAPEAIEGQGGDNTTYKIACRLRDFGVSEETALNLLLSYWNDHKAIPPWTPSDLSKKVASAFRSAKDRPGNAAPEALFPDIAVQDDAIWRTLSNLKPQAIERRHWLLSKRLLKGYITVTIAPGGVGKSLLGMLESLSLVTGKQLTYNDIKDEGPVWFYNAEDDYRELERRYFAIMKYYKIPTSALNHIHYTSGYSRQMKFAAYDKSNKGIILNERLADNIIKRIRKHHIKHFSLDPFVSLHFLNENDNTGINLIMELFKRIADEGECGVGITHHVNKYVGPDTRGNADRARGATALISASRIAHTFYPMSPKEAKQFGITPEAATWYSRLDQAKMNLAAPADSSDKYKWYKKEGVQLEDEPQDEWTGILLMEEQVIKQITDTFEDLIIDTVIQYVGPSENISLYNLSKTVYDSDPVKFGSAKTLQRKIELLFAFPVYKNGYCYFIHESVSDSNKRINLVLSCVPEILMI